MKRYRRFAAWFIAAELILIIIANVVLFTNVSTSGERIVREEIASGTIYRVSEGGQDPASIIVIEVVLVLMLALSVFLIQYIGRNVIAPFDRMTEMTEQLVKGNFAAPLKEEKSRFFGRFIWGLDMLREHLQDEKSKELSLHREKKTLLLSLAHDIKTPLSAIKLYTKALTGGLYTNEADRESAIRSIEKNVSEIENYVNQMSDASRDDFMDFSVEMGEVYLEDIIGGIRKRYADRLQSLHTEFVVQSCDNCLLACDEGKLMEVLSNLMENAIKYGDGKRIELFSYDEEDCKLITVKNSGAEPSEEEMPHLFDSFYRGSNSTSAAGSGLGLYIAKKLMLAMDGEIFAGGNSEWFYVTVVVRRA